jgi:hypothetical protein
MFPDFPPEGEWSGAGETQMQLLLVPPLQRVCSWEGLVLQFVRDYVSFLLNISPYEPKF